MKKAILLEKFTSITERLRPTKGSTHWVIRISICGDVLFKLLAIQYVTTKKQYVWDGFKHVFKTQSDNVIRIQTKTQNDLHMKG